jgi:hypothetical protein
MAGGVSADEHRDRQARTREAAAERGLDALAAVSRGGGTHDRVADALWLAGLTTTQPFVADLPGHWRAAGRTGVPLAEVARRCEEALAASAHARRSGVPAHLMGGFWGHGLWLGFEPPWIGPGSDGVVEEGMCLAIERRASVAGLGGAQHEDDVLVGRDGPELLT